MKKKVQRHEMEKNYTIDDNRVLELENRSE